MQSAAPFLLTSKKGHVLVDNGCGVVAQARLQNLQHPGPGAGYNKVKMITGRRLRSFWISAIFSCMNAEVILYTPPNTSLTSERPETDPPHVDSTSDAAIQQHSSSNRNNAIQDRLLDLRASRSMWLHGVPGLRGRPDPPNRGSLVGQNNVY